MRRIKTQRAIGSVVAVLCTTLQITKVPAGEPPEDYPGWRPATPAEAVSEAGAVTDRELLRAVFVIQGGDKRALGFLADRSGLVVTGYRIARDTPYVVVHLDEQRRVLAQTLAVDDRSLTVVVRVATDVVAGVEPLLLPTGPAWSFPRKGESVRVVRGPRQGVGLSLVAARVTRARKGRIVHDAGVAPKDVGGPILDSRGLVLGVDVEPPEEGVSRPRAVHVRTVLPLLERARKKADEVEPPPAREWIAAGMEGSPVEQAADSDGWRRDPADYRVRSPNVSLEFLTPRLIQSLLNQPSPSGVMGEAPWQWQRFGHLTEPIAILQVVPDLRWTGGSYFRVTGRVVSYPILAGVVAGLTLFFGLFAAMAGADDIPDFITPTAPLWRPVHAAYHFKGDFLEARLLRDGVEVPPIGAQRNCATTEVWIARKPARKPRWRTIRGCWGSYAYPVEAFAPGAGLEIRLFEDGQPEKAGIVPLPADLVARVGADFSTLPADAEGTSTREP